MSGKPPRKPFLTNATKTYDVDHEAKSRGQKKCICFASCFFLANRDEAVNSSACLPVLSLD